MKRAENRDKVLTGLVIPPVPSPGRQKLEAGRQPPHAQRAR